MHGRRCYGRYQPLGEPCGAKAAFFAFVEATFVTFFKAFAVVPNADLRFGPASDDLLVDAALVLLRTAFFLGACTPTEVFLEFGPAALFLRREAAFADVFLGILSPIEFSVMLGLPFKREAAKRRARRQRWHEVPASVEKTAA